MPASSRCSESLVFENPVFLLAGISLTSIRVCTFLFRSLLINSFMSLPSYPTVNNEIGSMVYLLTNFCHYTRFLCFEKLNRTAIGFLINLKNEFCLSEIVRAVASSPRLSSANPPECGGCSPLTLGELRKGRKTGK